MKHGVQKEFLDKKQRTGERKTKRDFLLLAVIALVLVVSFVSVLPMVQAMLYTSAYKNYTQDLIHSYNTAREQNRIFCTIDGKAQIVHKSDIDDLIKVIWRVGMGIRDRKEPETEGITIRFGDEGTLILSEVPLKGKDLKRDVGVQFRYIYADGKVFSYDTDEISYDQILKIIAPQEGKDFKS